MFTFTVFRSGGVNLDNSDYYMSLPYDVSGSLSKNRFRLELLWGISKMLDVYENENFIIIFDYVCDIEVHLQDRFEFYQIKTHKGNKVHSIADITRLKNGKSILGKLVILKKDDEATNIKLALVSNSYLKDDEKIHTEDEEIRISTINEKSLKKITEALNKELKKTDVDISELYYIFTPMNLINPENDIIGQIITSFIKFKGCEPKKPNALYRLIYDIVSCKACYELEIDDYKMIVEKKGITKAEFDKLLNCHLDTADNSVELTRKYINEIQSYKERRDMKLALGNLITDLQISKELQTQEISMAAYINENYHKFPDSFEQCIDLLIKEYEQKFSAEYSKSERRIFIVLILKRFEEGVYDEKTNI